MTSLQVELNLEKFSADVLIFAFSFQRVYAIANQQHGLPILGSETLQS